mmetsp:Transcript_34212/g.54828  ORF Transcript_34212/g.54828 Transcript_34212/m.54828 type:complete len:284 (-) Transcript_34212:417-1268(-)
MHENSCEEASSCVVVGAVGHEVDLGDVWVLRGEELDCSLDALRRMHRVLLRVVREDVDGDGGEHLRQLLRRGVRMILGGCCEGERDTVLGDRALVAECLRLGPQRPRRSQLSGVISGGAGLVGLQVGDQLAVRLTLMRVLHEVRRVAVQVCGDIHEPCTKPPGGMGAVRMCRLSSEELQQAAHSGDEVGSGVALAAVHGMKLLGESLHALATEEIVRVEIQLTLSPETRLAIMQKPVAAPARHRLIFRDAPSLVAKFALRVLTIPQRALGHGHLVRPRLTGRV